MAKDKITDLRHHLFAQLERLGDDELMADTEKRHQEINRAKAISDISQAIVNSAKLEIDYMKALADVGQAGVKTSFIVDNALPEATKK